MPVPPFGGPYPIVTSASGAAEEAEARAEAMAAALLPQWREEVRKHALDPDALSVASYVGLRHAEPPPAPEQPPPPTLDSLRQTFRAAAPSLSFCSGRLDEAVLRAALEARPNPRVVVSGPASFLRAMTATLHDALGLPRQAVVALEA